MMGLRNIQRQIMQTDFSDPAELLRPLKAIRRKCIDCAYGDEAEIRNCMVKTCPLWPYRLGHRPKYADCGAGNPT